MDPEEFECVVCGESFTEFPDKVEMTGSVLLVIVSINGFGV